MARCSNSRRKSAGRKPVSAGQSEDEEGEGEPEDRVADPAADAEEMDESEAVTDTGMAAASAGAIASADNVCDKLAHSATAAADGAPHGSHATVAARISSASSSGWCERRCATTHSSAGTSAGR